MSIRDKLVTDYKWTIGQKDNPPKGIPKYIIFGTLYFGIIDLVKLKSEDDRLSREVRGASKPF